MHPKSLACSGRYVTFPEDEDTERYHARCVPTLSRGKRSNTKSSNKEYNLYRTPDYLNPKSMQNDGPQLIELAQKAIVLYAFGVQVLIILALVLSIA